jgi:hypothetical protein
MSDDPINHPSHYTSSPARCPECSRPIECIDVAEHQNFCLGNAMKYLWRAGLKGDALEDLRKAQWYLAREIARRQTAAVEAQPDHPGHDPSCATRCRACGREA